MKEMILSILHDSTIKRHENFAKGLDIFTGNVDPSCDGNNCHGEIHTKDSWLPVRDEFCGTDGQYMPFAVVVFGDKSHTDLYGALSITPITFSPTF
jgi:hypothetical protein